MPQIRRSSSSASVRILRLDMVLCRLASIGSAAADMRRGNCAVGAETTPLISEGAILIYRDVVFAHCSSAHYSLPAAGHNNSSPTRAAL
jgi:hypothetical protein